MRLGAPIDRLFALCLDLASETELTVKTVREIMNEVLRKESLAVEERITKYKEEQFDKLNKLREKAFKEQQALIK